MDRIIEYLEKQIKLINDKKSNITTKLSENKNNIILLNDSIEDPDSIDVDSFKLIFEASKQKEIDELLIYKGWFSSNPDESQILDSLEKLKLVVTTKTDKLSKEIKELEEEVEKIDLTISELKNILDFASNYDKNTYVDSDMLDKLNMIANEIGIDDDMVKSFMTIAINNSQIELTRNTTIEEREELSSEQETSMANDRLEINSSEEGLEQETNEKEEFIKKIESFKTNEEYKMIDEYLFNKSSEIMDKISSFEYDGSDIKFSKEIIEEFGILTDSGENYFILTTVIELLNSYESNDIDKIKKIIDLYEESISLPKPVNVIELLKENNLGNLADLLIKLNEEYGIKDIIENNKQIIQSIDGLTEEERNISLGNSFDEEGRKTLALAIEYKDAIDLISDGNIDDEIIEELKIIEGHITSILEPSTIDLGSDVDEESSAIPLPYSDGDFENYVIVFNKKELAKSIKKTQEWMPVTNKKFSEFFIRKINTLINTPVSELIHGDNSHIIKIENSINNVHKIYDLRLGGNDIRVTYKILENAKVATDTDKKHGVIMIFNTCYAKTNKEDELKDSLTIFERNEDDRYGKLKKMFSNKKNEDAQQEEITDSFEIFKKIHKKTKGMGSK